MNEDKDGYLNDLIIEETVEALLPYIEEHFEDWDPCLKFVLKQTFTQALKMTFREKMGKCYDEECRRARFKYNIKKCCRKLMLQLAKLMLKSPANIYIFNLVGIAADLAQLELECHGYANLGKVVGAGGNIASGAMTGFALGGPIGAAVGGVGGFCLWGIGEVAVED